MYIDNMHLQYTMVETHCIGMQLHVLSQDANLNACKDRPIGENAHYTVMPWRKELHSTMVTHLICQTFLTNISDYNHNWMGKTQSYFHRQVF